MQEKEMDSYDFFKDVTWSSIILNSTCYNLRFKTEPQFLTTFRTMEQDPANSSCCAILGNKDYYW